MNIEYYAENFRCQRRKFIRQSALAPEICAPLDKNILGG
jgi:hypothetical protein